MSKAKQIKPKSNIRDVADEILHLEFEKSYTLGKCLDMFYDIMRKHGIKKGTAVSHNDDGVVSWTSSNYEWTMCHVLFEDRVQQFFKLGDCLYGHVPEDLRY